MWRRWSFATFAIKGVVLGKRWSIWRQGRLWFFGDVLFLESLLATALMLAATTTPFTLWWTW
jgi:hypothetical protein